MPIRIPEVNGMAASPAALMTSSRTAGRLSGEPWCGPPRAHRRSAELSSIRPCDTEVDRKAESSSALITPALRCGSRPECSNTSEAISRR